MSSSYIGTIQDAHERYACIHRLRQVLTDGTHPGTLKAYDTSIEPGLGLRVSQKVNWRLNDILAEGVSSPTLP
jgi:hypothetical protein